MDKEWINDNKKLGMYLGDFYRQGKTRNEKKQSFYYEIEENTEERRRKLSDGKYVCVCVCVYECVCEREKESWAIFVFL